MKSRITTIVLLVALFFSLLTLAPRLASFHLPGNHQGYEPEQPIPYSHRLHAGDLQIACQYCHYGAEKSRHAGIPAASVCMNCHQNVKASLAAVQTEEELAKKEGRKPQPPISKKLAKLFEAVQKNQPIEWVKVHNLPDFVFFDHRSHVAAGVSCQRCHGPVETMERVRQVESLSMGWCVNCHREVNQNGVGGKKVHASLDCAACHY